VPVKALNNWSFVGDGWNRIRKSERQKYQKNAYRVHSKCLHDAQHLYAGDAGLCGQRFRKSETNCYFSFRAHEGAGTLGLHDDFHSPLGYSYWVCGEKLP
jgi:hypothetical protein